MGQADPVQALSARLSAAVDDLVALDADTLTVDEAGALIEAVERDRNRLDAARTKLMASFSRRDGHRASGHKDLGHWMADRLRRSPGQARKEARTAEQLGGLSATAEALGNGDISLEHAAAIAEQAGKLDDPEGAQRSLLAEARTGDPRRVRKAGQRMRRDEERRAEEARKVRRAHEQRTLTFRSDEKARTMWVEGRLPLLDGVKVRAAIDALAAPGGRDDGRSYGQRMADGLVELVDRAEHGSGLPSQGGLPVEVMAVVPLEAIERRAGVPAGTLNAGPDGWIDLSRVELERILCEAQLSWLITDPDGVPLSHGKTQRFATEDQRRVLRARDGGCRWPNCDAPPEWCVVHHEPEIDAPDGATDVDKMALVCERNHDMRHKAGWTFELDDRATVTVTSPDGSIVMTETAAEARARHGAPDLLTVHTNDHTDDVARETPATYRTGRRHGRGPPRPGNGTVQPQGGGIPVGPDSRRARPRTPGRALACRRVGPGPDDRSERGLPSRTERRRTEAADRMLTPDPPDGFR